MALAKYSVDSSRSIEAIKAGNTAGSEALKAITTLLNAGSAGALLAFIGHLASISAPQATILSLRTALAAFVVGTFTAVFASGITYLSSSCTSFSLGAEFVAENEDEPEEIRRRAKKKERAWRVAWWITNSLAIILGGIALGSFYFGCLRAYKAFENIRVVQPIERSLAVLRQRSRVFVADRLDDIPLGI